MFSMVCGRQTIRHSWIDTILHEFLAVSRDYCASNPPSESCVINKIITIKISIIIIVSVALRIFDHHGADDGPPKGGVVVGVGGG